MAISREGLLEFLDSEFGLGGDEIKDETLLFTDGWLDSLSVASLLIYIEQQGGFAADPTEVTLDNLDSIEKILAYAATKAG